MEVECNLIERLRSDASLIREQYINKPFPRGNVAVIEVHLSDGTSFGIGATSRAKSPAAKPKARSEGGQLYPIVDPYSGRLMDTDAEYKALAAIADTLEISYDPDVEGKLYLYTERHPCESCNGVIEQFKGKFPNIEISAVFWDHPYPPVP
jgi:hypothetical protein